MAIYDIDNVPEKLEEGDVINCLYSGVAKTLTLAPAMYKFECWGGRGGYAHRPAISAEGGIGGYSTGTLTLTEDTLLYLYVGGHGGDLTTGGTASGGWNGGGSTTGYTSYSCAGGGGGTDIRINKESLYARVIVAGGGGGGYSENSSYYWGNGGYGGGLSGESYHEGIGYYSSTGAPGTQTSGYQFGLGSPGTSKAGGGGGWYGGLNGNYGPGAGGSGYVYTVETADNYPAGCLLTPLYYLANAETLIEEESTNPDDSGNGFIRIIVLGAPDTDKLYIKYNNNFIVDRDSLIDDVDSVDIKYGNTLLGTASSNSGIVRLKTRYKKPTDDIFVSNIKLLVKNVVVSDDIEVEVVAPIMVTEPSVPKTLVFNKSEQNILRYINSSIMEVVSGDVVATEVGTYSCEVALKDPMHYEWLDKTTTNKTITWEISKLTLSIPTIANYTYTGSTITPTLSNYDSNYEKSSGVLSALGVGTFKAKFSLLDKVNTEWADGTNTTKTVEWSIVKKSISIPYQVAKLVYNGSEQTPVFQAYDANFVTLGGTMKGTYVADYEATATLKDTDNTQWSDNTTTIKYVRWGISPKPLAVPTQDLIPQYTGGLVSPTWHDYDPTILTIGGTYEAVDIGTYEATFSLADKDNYKWNDNTLDTKIASWVLSGIIVQLPVINPTYFKYDGEEHSPTITYDDTQISLSGEFSGSEEKRYEITAHLLDPITHCWKDYTTNDKVLYWSIATFDYGDGSLNTVSNGYENLLYVNGKLARYHIGTYFNNSGNIRATTGMGNESYGGVKLSQGEILLMNAWDYVGPNAELPTSGVHSSVTPEQYNYLFRKGTQHHVSYSSSHPAAYVKSGTYDYPLNNLSSVDKELTVLARVHGGALTYPTAAGIFKFTVDGTAYTLQEMVENEIIKPLVVISSNGTNGPYYISDALNIYNGNNSTTNNGYGDVFVYFMLNQGHTITNLQLWAYTSYSLSYNDGLDVWSVPTEDCRLTLNPYD